MDVDAGRGLPHRLEHVQVVVPVEARVDAPLQAHLGRALRLGLGDAPGDLVELQQVRRAAEVQRERALGEGAEAALERADVGVVDVSVADEGDGVAHHLPAQVVGHLGHHADLGPAGTEEGHDLRRPHLLAEAHAGQDLGHGTVPVGDVPGPRPPHQHRRGGSAARAPRGVAGQPLGIGSVEHAEAQGRVQPALGVERERWVDGQPWGEGVPGRLGGLAEHVERRPRPLGVDVVGGDRGHATPIVDARVEQRAEIVGEVGGSLDMDLAREHQACRCDRPLQVLGRARLGPRHGRAGLGQEVLEDDLLHVTVAGVRIRDSPQRRQLAAAVVADADEDPRGEGDGQLAGGIQRGQPPCGLLVGRAPVRRQALGQRLEHHALARRDLAQARQFLGEERAGVGVGEEAGLLQDEATHLGEVVDRGCMAVGGEPVPCHGIAQLGPFAQREECLVAPRVTSGPGDGEHLLGGEVRRVEAGRRLGERAVAAAVAAQHGERDEHLGGVGHASPVRAVSHHPGQRGQVGERRIEDVGVGEHCGQSRASRREPDRPPATPCARHARGPPASPRRGAARRSQWPWTPRPP